MAFNVSEFRSQVFNKKFEGLSDPSKFEVLITPPPFLTTFELSMRELSFFCYSSNLPSRVINTIDYKYQGYGQTNKMPSVPLVDNLNLLFYSDSNFEIMNYFHQWMEYIVETGNPTTDIRDSSRAWREIAYKENYATTIELRGLKSTGKESNRYTFYNAFPLTIGEVSVGWEMDAEIIRIPVALAYDYYTLEKTNRTQSQEDILF